MFIRGFFDTFLQAVNVSALKATSVNRVNQTKFKQNQQLIPHVCCLNTHPNQSQNHEIAKELNPNKELLLKSFGSIDICIHDAKV